MKGSDRSCFALPKQLLRLYDCIAGESRRAQEVLLLLTPVVALVTANAIARKSVGGGRLRSFFFNYFATLVAQLS